MELIRATLEYSVEDYMRSIDYVKRRSFLYRHAVWMASLAMFAFMTLVILSLRNDGDEGGLLGGFIIATIAAVLVGGAVFTAARVIDPWFAQRVIRKQIAAAPILRERNEILFNESGMEGTNFFGASSTRWPAIIEAVETETDFYFYTSPKLPVFVPKRGFSSPDDIQELRSLLAEKLGDKAKLN